MNLAGITPELLKQRTVESARATAYLMLQRHAYVAGEDFLFDEPETTWITGRAIAGKIRHEVLATGPGWRHQQNPED